MKKITITLLIVSFLLAPFVLGAGGDYMDYLTKGQGDSYYCQLGSCSGGGGGGASPFTDVDNIYIYNNSGTITFNESKLNESIIQGDIYVNITGDTLSGDLSLGNNSIRNTSNIYIGSEDGDHYIYFYDANSPTAREIKWDNALTSFVFDAQVRVQSLLSTTQIVTSGDIYSTGISDDLWLGSYLVGNSGFSATTQGNVFANQTVTAKWFNGSWNGSSTIGANHLINGTNANFEDINNTGKLNTHAINEDDTTNGTIQFSKGNGDVLCNSVTKFEMYANIPAGNEYMNFGWDKCTNNFLFESTDVSTTMGINMDIDMQSSSISNVNDLGVSGIANYNVIQLAEVTGNDGFGGDTDFTDTVQTWGDWTFWGMPSFNDLLTIDSGSDLVWTGTDFRVGASTGETITMNGNDLWVQDDVEVGGDLLVNQDTNLSGDVALTNITFPNNGIYMTTSKHQGTYEGFSICGDSTGGYKTCFNIDFDDSTYTPIIWGNTSRDGNERLGFKGSFNANNDQAIYFGSASPAFIRWDSSNNDYLNIQTRVGSASNSGTLVFTSTVRPPENYPIEYHSTVRLQADDTSIANYIKFQHNSSNGILEVGNGSLSIATQTNNITMYSPDGNDWNCGVNNAGTWSCS